MRDPERMEHEHLALMELACRAEEAELLRKKRKHEARSPDAVRQARCHRRRRIADNYWEHFLRTGGRAESWIQEISPEIIEAQKKKMIARYPELARLRGLV